MPKEGVADESRRGDGRQVKRGKAEGPCAPPAIRHALFDVKTRSKDGCKVLGISRTRGYLFLCLYSFTLGIWIFLEECQSPWQQLHELYDARSSILPPQQQLT